MAEARYHDRQSPFCDGPIGSGGQKGTSHKRRKMVQVRFIAACRDGHMRDFPWVEWLGLDRDEWGRGRSDRWLRLLSTGSASAAGIVVVAERQDVSGIVEIKRRSLSGALGLDLGVKCDSQNPALGIGHGGDDDGEACGTPLQAVLRGASNLYFADVRSAIYVPEVIDATIPQDVLDLLDDHALKQDLLAGALASDTGQLTKRSAGLVLKKRRPESQVDPAVLADAVNKHILIEILTQDRYTATALMQQAQIAIDGTLSEQVVASVVAASSFHDWAIMASVLVEPLNKWVQARKNNESDSDGTIDASEGTFRSEEYAAFNRDGQEGSPKVNLLVRSYPIAEYEDVVRTRFSRVALLDKLRETRAFVGFSRLLAAPVIDTDKRWGLISRQKMNWLPAVVVRGEGIFLVFDAGHLDVWDKQHGEFHRQRLLSVNRNLHEQAHRRQVHVVDTTPKFVMLHTFAHALINQLTFDCGYGSSSLRERIYCSDEDPRMHGVLIYTAAGDAEGTMGGLVQMGMPGLLERTVARAIDRARWCSTDPICIESPGQGPNNCNLAACHACSLLPETSCEQQNRLLDRATLVGTLDRPDTGFFSF
ncbi:hypothetical protein BCCH1_29020 [Burkholderia contaminans]|nr:hypothetical protein BCCH1_29020 [Burkholderia contaminans]GLZ70293.1 hypothetical protein Bcon01_33380 [Burkholderia contaminans]